MYVAAKLSVLREASIPRCVGLRMRFQGEVGDKNPALCRISGKDPALFRISGEGGVQGAGSGLRLRGPGLPIYMGTSPIKKRPPP